MFICVHVNIRCIPKYITYTYLYVICIYIYKCIYVYHDLLELTNPYSYAFIFHLRSLSSILGLSSVHNFSVVCTPEVLEAQFPVWQCWGGGAHWKEIRLQGLRPTHSEKSCVKLGIAPKGWPTYQCPLLEDKEISNSTTQSLKVPNFKSLVSSNLPHIQD